MTLLYAPSFFYNRNVFSKQRYLYTAQCSKTDLVWQIPRTDVVEAATRELVEQLKLDSLNNLHKGNLCGVLLVRTATGEHPLLKGFSGAAQKPGWVPPLTAQARLALIETRTLARLELLKENLIALKQLPVHADHRAIVQKYTEQLKQLAVNHRRRKQGRDRSRAQYHKTLQGDTLAQALKQLQQESQQDSLERRHLKQARNQAIFPLTEEITQINQQIKILKQEYTELSQQWQTQTHVAYRAEQAGKEPVLTFEDKPLLYDAVLERVCHRAAAKLLHYAAIHQLQPIALAEFWWEYPTEECQPEKFYGASPEECQVLMQISQIPAIPRATTLSLPLPILYQDETLIVVEKPSGLPSVPGRCYHLQDSVLSRLQYQLADHSFLQAVHRLDQATSGVMVLAKSPSAHKALGQQFAKHQVHKSYEAILSRPIAEAAGVIKLPLRGNPDERPKQSVNTTYGKPSITHFEVLQTGKTPRVEFKPYTGRTHQLRIHAAAGLESPILGDSLYGEQHQTDRLYLHAKSLQFIHPATQKRLQFDSDVPF